MQKMIIDEWALDEFETMNYFSKIKSKYNQQTYAVLFSYVTELIYLFWLILILLKKIYFIFRSYFVIANTYSNIFQMKYAIANKEL